MIAFAFLRGAMLAGAAALTVAPVVPPAAHRPPVAVPAVRRAPGAVGTYVVRSVNGRAIPFADRLPAGPGYEHRATLSRAAVRLDPDGAFVLTAHYAHEHTTRSAPPSRVPAKDDAVRGRWTLRGTTLTLVPARSKRGRQAAPLVGQLVGGRLVLPYDVSTGITEGHYVFAAAYNRSYF